MTLIALFQLYRSDLLGVTLTQLVVRVYPFHFVLIILHLVAEIDL